MKRLSKIYKKGYGLIFNDDDVLEFEKKVNNGEGEAVRTDGQTDSAIANSAS